MTDSAAERRDTEGWKEAWVAGRTAWHMADVNIVLKKHGMTLLNGQKNLKVFVPLCGKTVDMMWFVDQGCSVTGVEVSELAIKQFFEENNLEYSVEVLDSSNNESVYKAKDKPISLYQCDLFHFPNFSADILFDVVWDRGSLVAIDPQDRERYSKLIASLLKQDGKCLLEVMDYNADEKAGPPHSLSPDVVQKLYGEKMKVHDLGLVDDEFYTKQKAKWNLSRFDVHAVLISWNNL